MPKRSLISIAICFCCGAASSQERALIEEIIVTAQRIEEQSNKVPMSVSAFTDPMIRDRQIVGFTDLQVNVPNLSYTQETFGGTRIAIRGIGDSTYDVTGRSYTDPAVPVHINGVSVPARMQVMEFYDLERLEVMRGPQGTLYGRTATAGAINLVTKRPDFDAWSGHLSLELGDYDHVRWEGVANLPVHDRLAFRLAGMSLERNGYTDNLAADDLPGINMDMDDRDFYSVRLTGEWRPTDQWTIRAIYGRFREDDSRLRTQNQVCKTSTIPVLGCEPDVFALEAPNPGASLDTLQAMKAGAIPFGAHDAASGLVYEFPRPSLSLREQHTDLNPIFEFNEDTWLFGVQRTFDGVTVELVGSYVDSEYVSRQDLNQDVGFVMNPTPANPTGIWPTSAPSGDVGAWQDGGPCDFAAGRAGVFGGCVLNSDLNRSFTYSHLASEDEFWSAEVRVRSDFSGRFNFLLGANHLDHEVRQDYYQGGNTYDIASIFGVFQPFFNANQQFYPPMGMLADDRSTEEDAVFGELYVNFSSRLKLTLGLRYSADEGRRERLVMPPNVATSLTPAPDRTWVRTEMISFFATPTPLALSLGEQYGATEAFAAATTQEERIAALQLVPIVPTFGERDGLLPTRQKYDNVTGRVVVDWSATDDALIYASFSQGYRPGGFIGFEPYDEETVNAWELGAKTRWADGSLAVNGTLFHNNFHDLQLFRAIEGNNAAINNVDADVTGFELEVQWRPHALPGLAADFTYGWLDADLGGNTGIDVYNRTQGNPELVLLQDIVPPPSVQPAKGQNYVAPVAQVLPWVNVAAFTGNAIAAPDAVYDNGIPAYFSRAFLNAVGVNTSAGIPVEIGGNRLPNAPRHSFGIGIAHTWPLDFGVLTVRYDYYWQDESFARVFNTRGDNIDSWDQHNASIIFESAGGRWEARAWGRNLADEDIVTGQFISDDLWGSYRSFFLAEPRIFGVSFRYNFGMVR